MHRRADLPLLRGTAELGNSRQGVSRVRLIIDGVVPLPQSKVARGELFPLFRGKLGHFSIP